MRFEAHEGKRMFNKRLTPPSLGSGQKMFLACGQKKSRG